MTRRSYRFVQVDVFTDRVFGGNPLAVFLDGQGLSSAEMQQIAREMNLSETTFILPAEDANCAARVRIFTPGSEMPFAGHPTIGTTFVLASHGMLPPGTSKTCLQENIGPIAVSIEGDLTNPSFIWMRHNPARFDPAPAPNDVLARAIGLGEADLLRGVPPEVGSTGVPFIYVPLRDRDAVDRAVSNSALIGAAVGDGPSGFFVFAPDGAGRVYSRMFATDALGISEDPATGAASGPLGAYILRHGLVEGGDVINIVSEQGTKMGRQSFIHIRLTPDAGDARGIEIGGSAVPVLDGTLYLD